MDMKLIIGLGNPGRNYTNNRHNIGFMCLGHFARTQGIQFDRKQGQARIGSGEVAGNQLLLARPQTYMNRSGQAANRLVNKYKIDLNDLLVIHDDLDLPLGTIRFRQGGSSGGHKGVDSIIYELESQGFSRLKVGIGRPITSTPEIIEDDIITYVLSDFTSEEKGTITQVIPKVSEAILCFITEGLTVAMNKYN